MTDDRRPALDRFEEPCARCGAVRFRSVDRHSGRYSVSLPSSCSSQDACEGELMRHFSHVADRDIPRPPATLEVVKGEHIGFWVRKERP